MQSKVNNKGRSKFECKKKHLNQIAQPLDNTERTTEFVFMKTLFKHI